MFKKSKDFYCMQVFIRIDEALTSADEPDVLTSILLETGAYHKKIPGFKPEMFWVIKPYVSGAMHSAWYSFDLTKVISMLVKSHLSKN